MKDLAIIINARKNSQRCKNKLLREFAGTTLLDIALSKLNSIGLLHGMSVYLASGEDEIDNKLSNYRMVKHIHRTYEELNSDMPATKIFAYHRRINHEWIMFVNPCLALLTTASILKAALDFQENNWKALTAVIKNHNWFYDQNMNPINNKDPKEISTKTSPWIYEVCHAFHIYNRKFFIDNDSYWGHSDSVDPFLFEISKIESIDVDTEEEFVIAENIYKKNN